jgi:hypothetical protein
MDWNMIGAIGELVGGAAVLVTLIYLAVQVRQGNSAGQRESLRGYVSELNNRLLEPQRDPEFVELFQQANRDWKSVSLRDQAVVSSVYSSYFFACAEAFALRESGNTDPALQYQADQAVASFLQVPGPAAWWEHTCSFENMLISCSLPMSVQRLCTTSFHGMWAKRTPEIRGSSLDKWRLRVGVSRSACNPLMADFPRKPDALTSLVDG